MKAEASILRLEGESRVRCNKQDLFHASRSQPFLHECNTNLAGTSHKIVRIENSSEQWHLIDIPDTGQTAQTEAPMCSGIKSRRLCGPFFNQEHPQHQSQHTNTIKSVRYQKLTNTPSHTI